MSLEARKATHINHIIFRSGFLTTGIRDLTDFNNKHKRDNPLNLCDLCSKNKTTDIRDFTDVNRERKREYSFNLCDLCSNINNHRYSGSHRCKSQA